MHAIIFDLDDTLFSEQDYVLSGFRAVADWAAASSGISARDGYAELLALYAQGVRGDTFNRWLEARGLASSLALADLIRTYREHEPTLAPFPEVVPLLERLREHHRIGLVSDGYLGVQQRKFRALGLEQYFGAVVFSDQLGRDYWKPSQRPFQTVLAQLNVEPARSIYVGDNPLKDFLGARQLGMKTLWVRRSDGEYRERTPPTPEHAPDLVVASLAEVEAAMRICFAQS